MIKENQKTKKIVNKVKELIVYIKYLGEIAGICTYSHTKEICNFCKCQKKQKKQN